MPDGRITRRKIIDHLRRLWIVYLAGIAVLIFLNNLVYTVTRPGFSDDETLKIMLLNVEIPVSEQELLPDVQELGFQTVEMVSLAAMPGDATGGMLLQVQLTAGVGDIYIADDGGFELLKGLDACLPLEGGLSRETPNGLHMVVAVNGTNTQSARQALDILAEKME